MKIEKVTANDMQLRALQLKQREDAKQAAIYQEGPRNKSFRDVFFKFYSEIIERETQLLEQKKRVEQAKKDLENAESEHDKQIIKLSIDQINLSMAENYAGIPFFKENLLGLLGKKWTVKKVLAEIESWKLEIEERYERSSK